MSQQVDELCLQLISELASFGIECSQFQAKMLINHLRMVIEKNKEFNLTRIIDPQEAVTLHIVDSLVPLASLRISSQARFLDIGTGAGYPGIPIAVLTNSYGTLLDSVGKKVAAVQEFVNALNLSKILVAKSRAEDYAKTHVGEFDYVFVRAVAQSNVLIEYSAPFLKMHGLAVLEKANPSADELLYAKRAAFICGMSFVTQESFELPHDLGHREILLFEKIGESQIMLPRSVGMAKKSPLGVDSVL